MPNAFYTKENIVADLKSLSVDDFITVRIFDSLPYVFRDQYSDYIAWRRLVANELQIDPRDIVITGSAAIGYSMNPNKNFNEFKIESDVDVCIISDLFFNIAWHDIRFLDLHGLSPKLCSYIKCHKEHYIFLETIATDKILPLLSFGSKWNQIMSKKRDFPELEGHDINFRIYRNMCSIREYQKTSVEKEN